MNREAASVPPSKSSISSPSRLFTVVLQSHSSSSRSCSTVTGPCHFILFSPATVSGPRVPDLEAHPQRQLKAQLPQHTCTNSPGVTVLPGKPCHCPTGPSASGERQWTETNLQSTPCHEVLSSAFISTRTTQLRLRLFFNWRPSGVPPKARETLWIGSLSHQPSEACSFRDLYPTPFSDGAGPCGRGDCVKKEHAAHDR